MDNNNNKLFVASLCFKLRDEQLTEIFQVAGNVVSAKVIVDRDSRSKGFGFVEMATAEEAQKAIEMLHGSVHNGREIVVNVQKPQVRTNSGGGGDYSRSNSRGDYSSQRSPRSYGNDNDHNQRNDY